MAKSSLMTQEEADAAPMEKAGTTPNPAEAGGDLQPPKDREVDNLQYVYYRTSGKVTQIFEHFRDELGMTGQVVLENKLEQVLEDWQGMSASERAELSDRMNGIADKLLDGASPHNQQVFLKRPRSEYYEMLEDLGFLSESELNQFHWGRFFAGLVGLCIEDGFAV